MMAGDHDDTAARSRALAHAYYAASQAGVSQAAASQAGASQAGVSQAGASVRSGDRTLPTAEDFGPAAVEARRLMRLAIWHRERSLGIEEETDHAR